MRPKISPIFLSQLVEQAPGRVRKRFDSAPAIAESWIWNLAEDVWSVQANEETVRLQPSSGVLISLDDVACTCLMSPKCFHVLACCNCLPLEHSPINEVPSDQADSLTDSNPTNDAGVAAVASQTVDVTDSMRASASMVRESLSSLLRVGARNAGILLQSGLLRAGHSCRASDLFALSNTMLRIAEGVQRFRQQSDESDSIALKEDVASAFFACHSLLHQATVPKWIVGQARRVFESLDVRKLNGVFAEPILTRSGFAGVSVYLQDPNEGGIYTVNELRTGDTSLIRQAYRGGIDLGGTTLEARTICRSAFAVQELTVSEDGRLGKGKSTRWATAKREWNDPFSSGRFGNSMEVQLEELLKWLNLPNDQRPGGWDVVALTATVMGSHGPTVVVDVEGYGRPWRLGIMIDSPELEYRHNLELIARCPRLRLRCLVRVNADAPYCADLLAIANVASQSSTLHEADPRLELPGDWQGICNTGLDRMERHFIRGIERWPEEIVLEGENDPLETNAKYTTPIERRLVGMVLGGRDAIPILGSKSHRRDCHQFKELFLPTAAYLLDLLATKSHEDSVRVAYDSKSASESRDESATAFLACDTYHRTTQLSLTMSSWKNGERQAFESA